MARLSRRIQISGGLLASLLFAFTLVSPMLYLPSALVKITGQSAWLAIILGNLGASLPGLLAIALSRRLPGLMPAQIARRVAGRWVGGLWGLLYGLFFIWTYGLTLRDMIDFGQVVLLPETPGYVVAGSIALTVLYVTWEGVEPIARISFAMMAVKVLALGGMPLTLVKEINLLQVEPFLDHGLGSLLRASGYVTPWFAECLIVASLAPNLRPGDRPYRWFLVGAGGSTLLLALMVLIMSLVFGPDLPSRLTYPTYSLIQLVTLGRTIGRIEVILAAVWISAIFLKLSLCLYATATAWSQALGTDTYFRKMLVLASVIGFLVPFIWSGPLSMIFFSRTRLYTVGTPLFTLLWPALLLLLARRRAPVAGEVGHG